MLNHTYIGTEHILLGLIHEGEGVAAKALESLGVSLEAVRQQVEEIIGQGQAAPTGHIPFTPRAKKVLELSLREALQLGHTHIGTEHILLGLIREGEGVGAQVLQKLGGSLDVVRERVIQHLGGGAVPAEARGGVTGLSPEPADDPEGPFDPIELLARGEATLRRAREMRNLSPLTGLPGNIRIQDEIQRQVEDESPFAVLYCDLDNFKAYNDHYGFVKGDRVIQATARALQEAVEEFAKPDGFLGHVGGDDFVVVVSPDVAEEAAAWICRRFDQEVAAFYDRDDRKRGFVEVEDRRGKPQRFGLVAISIGVATTSRRKFSHHGEAVDVAAEMKQLAKGKSGSWFEVDAGST